MIFEISEKSLSHNWKFRGTSLVCPTLVNRISACLVFVFVPCLSCVPCVWARRKCVGAHQVNGVNQFG